VATFGPGILAVLMLIFVATMVETNAAAGNLGKILFATLQMGIYAILGGTMFPGWIAAREVTDACDEPFQSQIPKL
jgi:hypothetical protein